MLRIEVSAVERGVGAVTRDARRRVAGDAGGEHAEEILRGAGDLAERLLRRSQPRRDQRVGIDDAVQPLEVAGEGHGLRGAGAERQAAVGDLAGVELLLRLDQVALRAHRRVAHGLRDGEARRRRWSSSAYLTAASRAASISSTALISRADAS